MLNEVEYTTNETKECAIRQWEGLIQGLLASVGTHSCVVMAVLEPWQDVQMESISQIWALGPLMQHPPFETKDDITNPRDKDTPSPWR